ncbi:MAG: hypothetical protein PHC94_07615 [Methylobacter sp.]|nr:hypothetical protein [Methylococcales bacterium]MDD5113869.1 hypothetical protein [Methylobacter sp.]
MGRYDNRREDKKDWSLLKIIGGVTAGILLAGAISTAAWLYFAASVVEGFRKSSQSITTNQASIRERELIAEKELIAEQARQIAIRDEAIRTKAEYERRFRAQYKKPPECNESRISTQRVKCANDYMNARAAFDKAQR